MKAILCVLALLFLSISSQASGYPSETSKTPKTVTLMLEKTDTRSALCEVMKNQGISYSIDPALQGKVSVDFKDEPLDKALKKILVQVQGDYWIESGIYCFVLKKSMDAAKPAWMTQSVNITKTYRKTDIQEVVKQLFKLRGCMYSLDPKVKGTVTLKLKKVPFDKALDLVLKQVKSHYGVFHGSYRIVPGNQILVGSDSSLTYQIIQPQK